MFDYTILGAGALGSVFGGRLAAKGHNVQLVTRSEVLGEVIAKDGLRLDLDEGHVVTSPVAVTPGEAAPARVVMLFTKIHQTEDAFAGIAHAMSDETCVLTLQNGLGNGARVAELVSGPVCEGVTLVPATRLSPGQVRSHGTLQTWIGPYGDTPMDLPEGIAADLNTAGFPIEVMADPSPAIWQKAAFNVAMNATAALIAGAPGLIGQAPGVVDLAHALAEEALTVARASGVTLDDKKVHDLIEFATREHPYHKPSMVQDIEAEQMTEIDALNGHVVDLAEICGIDVPLNRVITALVRGRQAAPAFWRDAKL